MSGLYGTPLDHNRPTRRLCGGNLSGENESCVGVTDLAGGEGFELTDTKPEGAGRAGLRFTAEELDTFAVGWIAERGLTA